MASADADADRLLRKHRVFLDLNERKAPGHEDIFDDVKALGNSNVETYRSPITIDSRQRPWSETGTMLSRVSRISEKARRCRVANKNEAGWRHALESDILSRFEKEVVCPECRARLWRAELEVAVTASDESVGSLEARQQRRRLCECPPRRFGDDRNDNGLNLLFDDRIEEHIVQEQDIEQDVKKLKGKRPDRIIGLRATRRIERILNETEGPDEKCVGECIRVTPFKETSQPLLFPFLVLEAKSEKSSDPFSKIHLQSGFAIRAPLDLQRDLFEATIENRQSRAQPLVWFLASKGEDWRVYGAYLEEMPDSTRPNYRILELWAGNITYEDSALGLLLIIDYIFDWARDVYRREIIACLLSLAPNATPSLADGTDVFSTADLTLNPDEFQSIGPTTADDPNEEFTVHHLLRFFDTDKFAVRDARYMQWSLCGLYITRETLPKLLGTAKNKREIKQFSRRLWRLLKSDSTWSLTAGCLNAIEETWTGKSRDHEEFQNPEEEFLASFHMRSYFAPGVFTLNQALRGERPGQWNQHHELAYVAVGRAALSRLREKAEFMASFLCEKPKGYQRVDFDRILQTIKSYRFAPTKECFLAALSHATRVSHTEIGDNDGSINSPTRETSRHYSFYSMYAPRFQEARNLFESCDIRQLPWLIYKKCKVGMTEPNESFLRLSQCIGKHNPNADFSAPRCHPTDTCVSLDHANAVTVLGFDDNGSRRKSQWAIYYCVFILDPPVNDHDTSTQSSEIRVYDKALYTLLKGKSAPQDVNNYIDEKLEDLQKSTEILEDVSTRYQVILSLPKKLKRVELESWIDSRYETLTSGEKTKWPYSFRKTVEGIKSVGESYGLGGLLQNLAITFHITVDRRLAEKTEEDLLKLPSSPHPRDEESASDGEVGPSSSRAEVRPRNYNLFSEQPASNGRRDRSAITSSSSETGSPRHNQWHRRSVGESSKGKRRASDSIGGQLDGEDSFSKRRRVSHESEVQRLSDSDY